MYDVLRADRCISAHALEGRVPFADIDFVDYSMSIDPAKKMNIYNKGKYLLRHAFENQVIYLMKFYLGKRPHFQTLLVIQWLII